MRERANAACWQEHPQLPPQHELYEHFHRLPREDYVDLAGPGDIAAGAGILSATYRRPYQMHASIGPSCAVALVKDGVVTVYSHTQGVYPLRAALAELLKAPPERVRVVHMEGSGCYGH